jgi:triosephosphate isomerase
MNKFVIGNWKMNGDALMVHAYAQALKAVFDHEPCDLGIAVPHLYVAQLSSWLGRTPVAVIAQDVSQFKGQGAYTGEISADMLKDAGCEYVLIGHSERRQYFAEDNHILQQKIRCAVDAGISPIICLGEPLQQRQNGSHLRWLEQQLQLIAACADCLPQTVWVAYEPVWAIGTGLVANSAQISEVHDFLARRLAQILPAGHQAHLLYGGSVKGSNAQEILRLPAVDGVLVGSASLAVADLEQIVHGALAA